MSTNTNARALQHDTLLPVLASNYFCLSRPIVLLPTSFNYAASRLIEHHF